MNQKQIEFYSGKIKLTGFLCSPTDRYPVPGVLFLHGGGKLDSNIYSGWQEFLCQAGFASFTFHFRGVGLSKGKFEDGSLNNRLKDAIKALEIFKKSGVVDTNKLAISGSSMGGHVAVRLLENSPQIKALILQSAAAYGIKAEDKKLDETFTQTIRKPNSWNNSPVFPILQGFKGATLLVYGEHDLIIPQDVITRYQQSFKKGLSIQLKNGSHNLMRPQTKQQEKVRLELYKKSLEFLNKYLI